MCECGCQTNWERYTFPAPGGAIYLLTIAGHCENCDGGSFMRIELIDKSNTLFSHYKSGEFINGSLKFCNWPDSKGVEVGFGHTKSEFAKAMIPHLAGIDVNELGDHGILDEAGAEVIAEEMYAEMQVVPSLDQQYFKPHKA
jgi:hypothetical protein